MPNANRSLDEIRSLLLGIEQSHHGLRDVISKINKHLDAVEQELGVARTSTRRRTGASTRYTVEMINNRPSLSEYRPTARPLRVGREIYDAVVSVLAQSDRPLQVDEIMTEVGKVVDAPPAEWQVRVIIRFMLRADPSFLDRNRSRYRPLISKRFTKSAAQWWDSRAEE